mgnify:CR=1 FL=1
MDINSKRKESEEIERLTQEYLERGGEITQCPRLQVVGPNQKWMIERGMDHTPWDTLGVTVGYHQGHEVIGPGCYRLKPKPFIGDDDR